MRYYFDISELDSINDVYCTLDYDGSGSVTVSDPVNVSENVYYYEFSWNDYSIPVGAPRIVFTLGSKSGKWDSSNDFSFYKLNSDFVTAPYIPVYINNIIMGGSEPFIAGDVNSDGLFNIADMVMIQKWLLGTGDITVLQAGDVNFDG